MPPETLLEIQGNLIRTIQREVIHEAPLQDMLDHLERRPPIRMPIMPRNRTLGFTWDESAAPIKKFNIALAQPPSIRLLPLAVGYRIADVEPRVALPWTIFVFRMKTRIENPRGADWAIDSVGFYFSKDEPTGEGDNLIPALLPNVYKNANICWGNTGVATGQKLMDRIDQTVNEFYQTNFNHAGDLRNNWPYYRPTYKRWVRETVEVGAGCYRNWTDWDDDRRTHLTLKDVLESQVDMTVPLVLPDAIPDMIVNPTFGRAEEWMRALTPIQRHRLKVAQDNLFAEDPNLFDVPVNVVQQAVPEDDD